MRYILTLTIGILAVTGASATTASAHDYHRSHHAVEAKQSRAHHHAKRRFQHRAHRPAQHHHGARSGFHRHQSSDRHSRAHRGPRYVIVFSPNGHFRIAHR